MLSSSDFVASKLSLECAANWSDLQNLPSHSCTMTIMREQVPGSLCMPSSCLDWQSLRRVPICVCQQDGSRKHGCLALEVVSGSNPRRCICCAIFHLALWRRVRPMTYVNRGLSANQTHHARLGHRRVVVQRCLNLQPLEQKNSSSSTSTRTS
jgi:hypothetical protein